MEESLTLADFLRKLRVRGYSYSTGYGMRHGVTYNLVKIFDETGKEVLTIDNYGDVMNAVLAPEQLANYKRICGL